MGSCWRLGSLEHRYISCQEGPFELLVGEYDQQRGRIIARKFVDMGGAVNVRIRHGQAGAVIEYPVPFRNIAVCLVHEVENRGLPADLPSPLDRIALDGCGVKER